MPEDTVTFEIVTAAEHYARKGLVLKSSRYVHRGELREAHELAYVCKKTVGPKPKLDIFQLGERAWQSAASRVRASPACVLRARRRWRRGRLVRGGSWCVRPGAFGPGSTPDARATRPSRRSTSSLRHTSWTKRVQASR